MAMASVITTNNVVSMGSMREKAMSMRTATAAVITMLPEGRMVPAAGEADTAAMDTVAEVAAKGDNNEGVYAK